MGLASSKAAASKVPRRYSPTPSSTVQRARPSKKLNGDQENQVRREHIVDPPPRPDAFSERLQQMGIAQPHPTYSPSSTASRHISPAGIDAGGRQTPASQPPPTINPVLSVLQSRERLQRQAKTEFDALGEGHTDARHFIDMRLILTAMRMRRDGAAVSDIEHQLRLRPGLLSKLGRPGVLSHISLD